MAVKTAPNDEDRALAGDELGQVLTTEGDLAKAVAAYEADLAIYRRLSAGDPANPIFLREVSVSLNNIGDASQSEGDLAGALKAFDESLGIRRTLAAADAIKTQKGALDANDVLIRRDLAAALDKVAGVLLAQRDLAGALKNYLEALNLRNELLPASPHLNDVELEHDVVLSMFEIGDLMVVAQRPPTALDAYQNALKLSHNLIASTRPRPSSSRTPRPRCIASARSRRRRATPPARLTPTSRAWRSSAAWRATIRPARRCSATWRPPCGAWRAWRDRTSPGRTPPHSCRRWTPRAC
jgi:tetratricopeptide (TPR) repeat protein